MPSNIKTNSLRAWFLAARPKTLTAALVPVAIANALAFVAAKESLHSFSTTIMGLTLLFAVVMQIMANFINDYVDFINGTDDETRIGPERACAMGWISPQAMRIGIGVSLTLAMFIGLYAVFAFFEVFGHMPWPMFGVGILCMVFAFLYSTYCSYHALGDLLVLVFFGFIPVAGTYYLHFATCNEAGLWPMALGCGAAICTLLTVNNIRDRHQDKEHGKTTLVVVCGEKLGFLLYLIYGLIAAACQGYFLSRHTAIGIATGTAAATCIFNLIAFMRIKRIGNGKKLNKMLAVTSLIILFYGVSTVAALLL